MLGSLRNRVPGVARLGRWAERRKIIHMNDQAVKIWVQLIELGARVEALARVVVDCEPQDDQDTKNTAYLRGIVSEYDRILLEIGDYDPEMSDALEAGVRASRERLQKALEAEE